MNIGYVAKHDQTNSNDDEGAIYHALTELGHKVLRLRESAGRNARKLECDFILFHKWHDLQSLRGLTCPKVFWYFDLVEYSADSSLARRCGARKEWMYNILQVADLGFCTDGDWVAKDRTGKLVHLCQGADTRVVGRGQVEYEAPSILFTGIGSGGGRDRLSFVEEMKKTYGKQFNHIQSGIYGRPLANLIAGSKIVLAPDSPITDRYWSNRVFNALGFSAFMLHPYCKRLAEYYEDGKEIIFYYNRGHLHDLIKKYLNEPKDGKRQAIATAGYLKTLTDHTYLVRCQQLVQTVQKRIF